MNKEDLQAISELLDMKLRPIQSDIKDLKDGQKNTNQRLDRIEKKLDAVNDQTTDLTEFRTETGDKLNNISSDVEDIKETISTVEMITSKNWNDIAKLKTR
jgi:archaellum component FlaC